MASYSVNNGVKMPLQLTDEERQAITECLQLCFQRFLENKRRFNPRKVVTERELTVGEITFEVGAEVMFFTISPASEKRKEFAWNQASIMVNEGPNLRIIPDRHCEFIAKLVRRAHYSYPSERRGRLPSKMGDR